MDLGLILLFLFCFAESKADCQETDKKDVFDQGSNVSQGTGSEEVNKKCFYSEWSKWSKCTKDCIDFENLPTKYRTRKVLNGESEECVDDHLGTMQFQICTDLPPCSSGSWVKNIFTEVKMVETYDKIRKQMKSVYPEWAITAVKQYPSIIKDVAESTSIDVSDDIIDKRQKEYEEKNKMYKFEILKSVKRTTMNHVKCGCPSKYIPVTFWEFINNQNLMARLPEICEQNKYNQLVFEGNGRYIYYCNIGMIIRDLESEELTCNSLDSTEYVVCKRKGSNRNIVGGFMDKIYNGILNILALGFVVFV